MAQAIQPPSNRRDNSLHQRSPVIAVGGSRAEGPLVAEVVSTNVGGAVHGFAGGQRNAAGGAQEAVDAVAILLLVSHASGGAVLAGRAGGAGGGALAGIEARRAAGKQGSG